MFLRKKILRAFRLTRERRLRAEGRDPERENPGGGTGEADALPTPEELLEAENRLRLEKEDLPALITAALITIVPACLPAMLGICLAAYLFFFAR